MRQLQQNAHVFIDEKEEDELQQLSWHFLFARPEAVRQARSSASITFHRSFRRVCAGGPITAISSRACCRSC